MQQPSLFVCETTENFPLIRNDHYIEQQITHANVEDALYRFDTNSDIPVRGRLSIFPIKQENGIRTFGRWEYNLSRTILNRMYVTSDEQKLCDKIVAEINGSDPIADPAMDAIIERLESATTADDDADKPVCSHNGRPVYAADRADHAKGGTS